MALATQRTSSAKSITSGQRHVPSARRTVRVSRVADRSKALQRLCISSYKAPSTRTGANELAALSNISNLVPDTILLQSAVKPKAATVSSLLLSWILANEQLGMKPYENAIKTSLNYDKCLAKTGEARLSCQLDKALCNVGSLLATEVEGRVCTEIDPRLANDKDAMVSKAHSLLALYEEMGVNKDKLIFVVPATWAGIQAAAALELDGIAMQAFHIYSYVQGVAAAQSGVSVIQPNVGRTRDWYNKRPGIIRDPHVSTGALVIRDPHGPREDSGFSSGVDTGVRLVSQVYTYCKKYHPKTKVMASGLRRKEDALALAGCDYLVLTAKVMAELEASPTLQGYNAGLSASGPAYDDAIERPLSPEAAKSSDVEDKGPINETMFNEQLGPCGQELLSQGLQGLMRDVETLLPYFRGMAGGME